MSGGSTDTGGADVGVHLKGELERLAAANPFETLGLPLDATGEQVRATFLSLTKRYHPNRYARMDREVVRLANEIFLRVKDAYAQLNDEAGRKKVLESIAPTTRRERMKTVPGTPAARSATASWHPAAAPPADRGPSTARRPIARGTPRTTPSVKTQRPVPARTGTVRGVRAPTGRATGSQRRRPTDANELEQGLQDTIRRRNDEYEAALRLLTQGRYREARTVFHRIAADDPKTKKYRVQMHYAWGLEHEDAGNFDDARKELERALTVDPQFKRAHEALDRLPGGKKDGFFKKFFGR